MPAWVTPTLSFLGVLIVIGSQFYFKWVPGGWRRS
jgi:hypothetical protein